MRRRRAIAIFFVIVFSIATVYLLYEGASSGDYVLVALVLVAYMFVLLLEASLSVRRGQPQKK